MPSKSGIFALASVMLLRRRSHTKLYMARKLYIFNPSGRLRVEGPQKTASFKWLGSFTDSYLFLGDQHARLLGVGNRLVSRKLPGWLKTPPPEHRSSRGGASRHDPNFRGWG